jgi:hypothetical protein
VSDLLSFLPPDFMPALLGGMVVNFQIASLTLIASLLIGGLLTAVSLTGGFVAGTVTFLISMIRAMPTFLVMISLLYLLPRQIQIAGLTLPLSNISIVVLSLLPYGVAYVFDNFSESIRQWRRGQMVTALQLLPNLSRMYFILIMSSASGAAIGVTEGVATLMRYSNRVETVDERLMIFAVGIVLFGLVMQAGFALVNVLRAALTGRVSKEPQSQA